MSDKIAIKQQSAVAQKARKNPAIDLDMPLREKVLCQNTRKASVPTLISMDLGNELISKDDLPKTEKYMNDRTQSMNEISLQGKIPGIGNDLYGFPGGHGSVRFSARVGFSRWEK